MIFHQNRRGTRGPGSNPVHHDAVDWGVIGPGTRYIKVEQTGSTLNTLDLVWKLRDRVVLPNEDFYGGVWSECLMRIESSTDGKILNAEGRAGKDLDWLKFNLRDHGKYEIRVIGRFASSSPLILLYDQHG